MHELNLAQLSPSLLIILLKFNSREFVLKKFKTWMTIYCVPKRISVPERISGPKRNSDHPDERIEESKVYFKNEKNMIGKV